MARQMTLLAFLSSLLVRLTAPDLHDGAEKEPLDVKPRCVVAGCARNVELLKQT
jgi:hypothetical protein